MSEHPFYHGPVFEMARRQFVSVADHLEIPVDERDRLLLPSAPSRSPAPSIVMIVPLRSFRVIAFSIIALNKVSPRPGAGFVETRRRYWRNDEFRAALLLSARPLQGRTLKTKLLSISSGRLSSLRVSILL